MSKTFAYLICPQSEKHLLQEFIAALEGSGITPVYEETYSDNEDYRMNHIDISKYLICCSDNWLQHSDCIVDMRYGFRKCKEVIVGETPQTINHRLSLITEICE